MIDPTKIDFNQIPKKFCEGAVGTFGKDTFAFGITSGNNIDSFATTPQVMKSIAQWMNKQVENYEREYGEIKIIPGPILSPIQISDLHNNPSIE